jgi:hypothetical protein
MQNAAHILKHITGVDLPASQILTLLWAVIVLIWACIDIYTDSQRVYQILSLSVPQL